MISVGKAAPQFTADAIVNGCIKKISLDDFGGSYKIIFFYPLDFSFVCPTELQAFQEYYDAFKGRSTEIIAISVDSIYSHLAWLSLPQDQGGIKGIQYPLVGDITKNIARSFGVLDEETGVATRAMFVLDKKNIIQSIEITASSIGRSTEEALRLLDAMQYVERHGEVCPANWHEGNKGFEPTQKGLQNYCSKK